MVHSERIRGGALALALVLVLGACDGGDGDASLPVPAPEPAHPAADADAPAPAPIRPRADAGAVPRGVIAERAAAAAAAVAAAQRMSLCASGIEFLDERLGDFEGPAAERDVIRAGIDSAVAARANGDVETCLGALADPFAVLGFAFAPGPPEPVPCVRGIDGTIAMLDELNDDVQAQTRAFLVTAVEALEAGDVDTCVRAVGEAQWIVRDAQLE